MTPAAPTATLFPAPLLLPLLPAPESTLGLTLVLRQLDTNLMIAYLDACGRGDLANALQANSRQDPDPFIGRFNYLVSFADGAAFKALFDALFESGPKGEVYAASLVAPYGMATGGQGVPGGLELHR